MTPEQISAARALVGKLRAGDAMNGHVVNCKLDRCNCAVMDDAASTITAILDALAAAEAELKVTEKLLSDEARQSLDRLERAEAAEARAADLTAKLEKALQQREVWMNRAMNELGENLNNRAALKAGGAA